MNATVNYQTIDNYMYSVKDYLERHYDSMTAWHDMQPLDWYIETGRASTPFLRLLLGTKPFLIARRLHKGGSYDEAITRIKSFLGYRAEA